MRQGWEDYRIAGGFLTIFPVARGLWAEPQRLARSMAFFPAVGLTLGLALVALEWALAPVLPRLVLDALLVLFLIVATGGLHLDGLADLTDGLAGGRDREGALRIMKDSRVGAMGAIALVMALLLKYLSLYSVPLEHKSAALLLMPAAGRWIQVVLASFCRYVRPEGGTGGAFVDHVGRRETVVATATLAAASVVFFGVAALLLLLCLVVAAFGFIRYFKARLGGVTGDVLGAATEVTEVLALILILALYAAS